MARQSAARSAGLRSRKPASSRPTRVRSIRSPASTSSSGGRAIAVSSITSTATPPAPNSTTGPKDGSRLMPSISSCACLRTTMGCTAKPAMSASGKLARTRFSIAAAASRAAAALSMFSTTPPASDLCVTAFDNSLTTTFCALSRSRAAACPASSGVRATAVSGTGMP